MLKMLPLINSILILILIITGWIIFQKHTNKPEMAYINKIELFNKFNMTKDLNNKYLPEINNLKHTIDSLYTIYKIFSDQGNEEKKLEIESQLKGYDQELQLKGDYMSTELSKQVWDRLNEYVEDYGKSNKYTVILGTQGKGTVMYAKEGIDVTEEFIVYANTVYEGNIIN